MMAPTAYPLTWPPGWPRTAARTSGIYRKTMAGALQHLKDELRLLAGVPAANTLVLSSNVTLGSDRPTDPGVVAYFLFEGEQVAIPCDRWIKVEHNVQAIALTIEAMRAIERHGAKHMVKAMFRGFIALPAPVADWRALLGNPPTLAEAEQAYRAAMKRAHPDMGGSHAAGAALNVAIAEARKALT